MTLRRAMLVFLVASLPTLGGCQWSGRSENRGLPAEPPSATRTGDRGGLLDTGSFHLAPEAGAGRGLWRTQGDGLWGF
jgi:hypothetical protein